MTRHLQREIEAIKRKLLVLCAMVEKSVALAVKSIGEQDAALARTVISEDVHIDRMEVELEEDCLKVLALYQPVAVDLRSIVAVLKMNNEIERVGDLAVNIAERAEYLASQPLLPEPFDFDLMSGKVRTMLRKAVDAFVEGREQLAYEVCRTDDDVDAIHRDMYKNVEALLEDKGADVTTSLHLLAISRDLERMADRATNIAEDVMYMISGDIVRHHVDDDEPPPDHKR